MIKAERVGNHWVVDESEVAKYQPRAGRPLSGMNAWRIANYAADGHIADIHPMEKSRLRRHLVSLLEAPDPASKIRSLLAERAEKFEFSSSPADLADLREDERIKLSGVSHPASGLLSNSELEAYVSRKDFEAVIKDWFLVKARAGQRANVLLHVAEEIPDELPPLVVAADLAERPGVREQQAAREIIGGIHSD